MANIIFAILRAAVYSSLIIAVIFSVHFLVTRARRARRNGSGIFSSLLFGFLRLVGVFVLVIAIFGLPIIAVLYVYPKIVNARIMENKAPNTDMIVEASVKVPDIPEPGNSEVIIPPKKTVKRIAKFEVRVREGMTVKFVKNDGTPTGSILRHLGDNTKTMLALPVEPESVAIIFPIRAETDCSFETKQTQGEYIACQRVGSFKVENEVLGIGYATFDAVK